MAESDGDSFFHHINAEFRGSLGLGILISAATGSASSRRSLSKHQEIRKANGFLPIPALVF